MNLAGRRHGGLGAIFTDVFAASGYGKAEAANDIDGGIAEC